ncbi:hypothetical protein [uncultured Hoeflea sp.]|uniref:hypothetical protein n=1 Tax=uncultured Hoeflea sp. TaxID=538666 RepID=UPI0030D734EA
MKFAAPKPRRVALTDEWAQAITTKAMQRGAYSLALTQALQWDSGLRRIHIIGKWQPGAEGSGGVIRGSRRRVGPLIVNEDTGLPCSNREYTKLWRTITREIGVPGAVWPMETRTGAVTEVEETFGLSIAGKFAAHSNTRTTLGYVRDVGVKVSRLVANARRKMRKIWIAWNSGTGKIAKEQER